MDEMKSVGHTAGTRIDCVFLIALVLISFAALAPSRITLALELNLFSYRVSPVALGLPVLAVLVFVARPKRSAIWLVIMYAVSLTFLAALITYHNQPDRQVGAAVAIMTALSAMIIGASVRPEKAKKLVKWALGIAIVSLLMGMFVLAISATMGHEIIGWTEYERRLRTPFGSSIATGSVLIFTLIILVFACLQKLSAGRILLLSVVAIGIALTGSRAVFFASAIGLVIFLSTLIVQRATLPIRLPSLLFLVGCVGIAGILMAPTGERLVHGIGAGGGDTRRVESIEVALEIWRERPLFGQGGGLTYPIASPGLKVGEGDQHIIKLRGKTSLIEPHNLYAMLLVEYGLFGAILFTAPLVLTSIILLRSDVLICRSGGIAAFTFLLFQLSGSHWYLNDRVAIWIGVLLGALLALNQTKGKPKRLIASDP